LTGNSIKPVFSRREIVWKILPWNRQPRLVVFPRTCSEVGLTSCFSARVFPCQAQNPKQTAAIEITTKILFIESQPPSIEKPAVIASNLGADEVGGLNGSKDIKSQRLDLAFVDSGMFVVLGLSLRMQLNSSLHERDQSPQAVRHFCLRWFKIPPCPIVSEFISKARVDSLHHSNWFARVLCLRNAGFLAFDKPIDLRLLIIVNHQQDVVEVHEFLCWALRLAGRAKQAEIALSR